MAVPPPAPERVLAAIDTYLKHAYEGAPPTLVRSQLASLRAWRGDFYRSPLLAPDPHVPPTRYSVRLGNRQYPHMKMVMELSPNDQAWLFKADTHDRHCCPPPTAPEHGAFCELMDKNQKISTAIENAWASENIPTFKTYLREDLERRRASSV